METMKDYEDQIESSFRTINEGDMIKGTVIDVTDEEVTLDLRYYTQGIIKVADLSDDPNFSVLDDVKIGDEIEATVTKVDDGNGNILLSKKEANSVLAWDVLKEYKESGKEFTVKVSQVVKGGAVAYLEGIRGFIPASQLDVSYVEDLSVFENRKLTVRVTEVNKDKQKLIMSAREVLKEKLKEEHDHKVAMLVPGTITEGKVESLQTFGAFVDIGEGLSGLVHISQICDHRIKKPSEVLKVGDTVKVKILNTNDGKISLSIKAAEEESGHDEKASREAEMYSSNETIGTGLGELLKGIKL
ncbi:MAG: S1 RNA-binding domain-containing protein [Lachnospiraceae bacterium]|nr:S1 RNA-binding domain-containing protein [Lachnospiraceae bacterium]MBR5766251.1 S1 RNA-binding domain-containing protein [Lachnospiraceae bacterium]MBR6485257.1 S1 RNA-binding domain-containing protein [Lachnospiraceae bacterium]